MRLRTSSSSTWPEHTTTGARGTQLPEIVDETFDAHARENAVGAEQVDAGCRSSQQCERGFGVAGLEHAIACAGQRLLHHLTHERFVVDEQDRRAHACFGQACGDFGLGHRARRGREHDGEATALVGALSTVILPRHWLTIACTVLRPRPVPLPPLLGGEERLEDVLLGRRVHAAAGVAHREREVLGIGRQVVQVFCARGAGATPRAFRRSAWRRAH